MIAAIVLAAGLGTRMGTLKPVVDVAGRPSLARILDTLRAVNIHSPIVVVGHEHEAVREAVDLSGCRVVRNPRPEDGLSSSLACGLGALGADIEGAMVFHADMPLLLPSTVQAVVERALSGAALAAPEYAGQRGFPVFFRSDLVADLRNSLHGDRGGRDFIEAHRSLLETVKTDDPGCIRDFDTPEDVAAWKGASPCTTS